MKELFKNCLFVDETDGWYTPSRFTRSQLEYYGRTDSTWKRSVSPSSVVLRFKTAATKLSLDYKILAKARDWAVFDVLFDGKLFDSVTLTADEGKIELSLPGDPEREVNVFLPHLVVIKMKNITANAPLYPTLDREKRWLALGDSITQGMVARHPLSAYPSLMAEALGYEVINAGVGGIEFNADELDYIGFEPDLITVALGTNDWNGISTGEMTARVTAYFDKLLSLYACENIYAITPIWRSDDGELMSGVSFAEHCGAIARAVSRYPRVRLIDGYGLVPHDSALFGDPTGRLVHPNEQGFGFYSKNLLKAILKK